MENEHNCWDLAVSLSAHHSGDHKITAVPLEPARKQIYEQIHQQIYQVSTIRSLVAGVFDGDTPYSDVIGHGDFGVGTFNALDGEMAAVDGRYYHLYSDGSVTEVDPTDLTPFAAVTFFRADAEIDVETTHSREELLALVDETVPSTNLFYAIRVEGSFGSVTTRTAARQHKPYPRLVAATATQVEHTFSGVRGTLVGFRAPQYAQGTTVAGYHLHFLDHSRTVGGHVLDFTLESGSVTLDLDTDLHVEVPPRGDFRDGATDGATDGAMKGAMNGAMDAGDIAAEIEQSESRSART